jgi:hypothetical protein
MPIDVLIRCQNCGRVRMVDGRTAEYPDCECGAADWRLQLLGAGRVERLGDDDLDLWRDSYDDWKTREPHR